MHTLEKWQEQDFVRVRLEDCEFKVHRSAFVNPAVRALEIEKIFSACWLYLGHETELPCPDDYRTRKVGGRNLIFNRDSEGKIRAFFNTCSHRGAMVCRERQGNSKTFQCFYHAWTFSNQGKLIGLPGRESYPEAFNGDNSLNLCEVPRLSSYRGLVFVSFDPGAVELEEYLAGAREYIDLVVDQSEVGMEILGGTQEYSLRANWKLLCENSADGYHAPTTHKTYFDYLKNRDGSEVSKLSVTFAKDLGNGHSVIETVGRPWGRPVAKWIPSWGENAKAEIEQIKGRLVERFGVEKGLRMAESSRNMIIFPNLILLDGMSITVRTFFPVAPDYTEVAAWALAPKDENKEFRARRLNSFLEFFGPGGLATPDDNEALELCQEGFKNFVEAPWNDISKGMNKEAPAASDEHQMRVFWMRWNELITR
jgi:p-cumate 2,3-dioxygenase subunit alpha